ncbi:hypothetical protein K438DRAFT_1750188 [Mycena galopus ATCC 62051]|nr:hypothetical protein K438DRAFT_1750188 [Mycena galopus ATCC 62051]
MHKLNSPGIYGGSGTIETVIEKGKLSLFLVCECIGNRRWRWTDRDCDRKRETPSGDSLSQTDASIRLYLSVIKRGGPIRVEYCYLRPMVQKKSENILTDRKHLHFSAEDVFEVEELGARASNSGDLDLFQSQEFINYHKSRGVCFDYGQEFVQELEYSPCQVSNRACFFILTEGDDTDDDYSGARKYYSDGEEQEYDGASADSLNEATADKVDKPVVDSPSSEDSNENDLSECEEAATEDPTQVELSESKAEFNPNSEGTTRFSPCMRSLTTALSAATVEAAPQFPRPEELEFFTPSQTWNIIMFAQLSLMILLGTFSLLRG